MKPTNSAYSPLKVFHHRACVDALHEGRHIAPVHVQLVPTNRCNQSCEGCAYRLAGYPSSEQFEAVDQLSWSKLAEIVHDCRIMGVRAIELTGGGEPSIHPQFLQLCEAILAAGIDLGLVTNGARWCSERTEVLSRAMWVRFSLDAACPETYAAYRHAPIDMYETVRGNIRSLVEARKGDLLVGVGFVVTDRNWQEVVQAAKHAREDGADNLRISALFQPRGRAYYQGFYGEACRLCREAEGMSNDRFRVFNLFGDRLSDLRRGIPDYGFCGYSRLTTYLASDGNAYTCCMNAYNSRGFLGSFQDQRFRTMWFLDETRKRLYSVDPRKCPRCMYNGRNETIAYAVNPDPCHVNFL